jgi:hypothetical protein
MPQPLSSAQLDKYLSEMDWMLRKRGIDTSTSDAGMIIPPKMPTHFPAGSTLHAKPKKQRLDYAKGGPVRNNRK